MDVKPDVTLGRVQRVGRRKAHSQSDRRRRGPGAGAHSPKQARLDTAEKEAVEEGEYVVIDFDGYINDEPFQGGAVRGQLIEVGGDGYIPGFAQQLVGMKIGEEREIEVTFPEDYREDLAGKQAKFVVRLQEIKTRVVPELDDELAKDIGEFETLAELREDARKRLEETAANEAEVDLEADIIKKVTDAATVDIPEVMIDQEVEQMKQELRVQLAAQRLAHARLLWRSTSLTEEQLKRDLRPGAERRVKTDLVLEAIGRAENLEVTEEEVDERMRAVLGPGRDEKELQEMMADEDRRDVSAPTCCV